MENKKLRKAIALVVAGTLVVTSMTYIGSNNLKAADEEAANQVEQVVDEEKEMEAETAVTENPSTSSEKIDISIDDSNAEPVNDAGSTSEKTDVEETDSAEETKMPAQSFDQTADNGIRVVVSAPEGAFPEGTKMVVKSVSVSRSKALLENSVDDVKDAKGVDITFVCNGKEIEPEKNIKVQLSNAKVEGENFNVYHVEDNGAVERVPASGVSGNGATFHSDEFSIYIVEGSEPTIPDDNQLSVRVSYYSTEGVLIQLPDGGSNPYTKEVDAADGKFSVSIKLPEISGKNAEIVSQDGSFFSISNGNLVAEISEDALGDDKDIDVNIQLASTPVKYSIIYKFQNADGTYTTDNNRSQIDEDGYVGDSISIEPERVDGFETPKATRKVLSANRNENNFTVEYKLRQYHLAYNTNGGYFANGEPYSVAGVYGQQMDVWSGGTKTLICTTEPHTHTDKPSSKAKNNKNNTIGCWTSKQTDHLGFTWGWTQTCGKTEHSHTDGCYAIIGISPLPVREGYSFKGWYTDPACTQQAPDKVTLDGDVKVYAKWEPSQSQYTVVFLAENADDDGYSYVGSSSFTANTGDSVTFSVSGNPSGIDTENFSFKNATTATVKADGSTVIKAYYSRNTYTITWNGKYYAENARSATTVSGRATLTAKYGSNITQKWQDTFNTPYKDYAWNFSTNNNDKFVGIDTMPSGNKEVYAFYFSTNKVQTLHYWLENYNDGQCQTKTRNGKTYGLYKALDVRFNYLYDDSEFYNIEGYTKGDHEGCSFGSGTRDGQQVHFYYLAKSFPLDLICNGEKVYTGNVKLGTDISSILNSNIPEQADGQEFHWYSDAECTTEVTDTKMPQGLVLYGKWTLPSYEVQFLDDDGESLLDSQTIEKGKYAETFTPEVKDGFTFDGWFTAPEGGEAFQFNEPITSEKNVYAHWTTNTSVGYTVKYVDEHGTPLADNKTGKGDIGDTVIEKSILITGGTYLVNKAEQTIKLNKDESRNVITFVYTKTTSFNYQVVYKGDNITLNGESGQTDAATKTFKADMSLFQKGGALHGYELAGDRKQSVTFRQKDNEIVFKVKPIGYTISYEGAVWNGENPNPGTYTVEQLKTAPITLTDPADKDDEVFVGWEYTGTVVDNDHNPTTTTISNGSYGNLTFTAKYAKLSGASDTKVYSGQPQKMPQYTFSAPAECGYSVHLYNIDGEEISSLPTRTNVGTTRVTVKAISSKGYKTLEEEELTLTITPATLTITTPSDSKAYDGTALTAAGTCTGFVRGETATFTTTGSQTTVGSSKNTYTLVWDGTAMEGNYTINATEGRLTVTEYADEITVTPVGGTFTYDGKEHKGSVNVSGLPKGYTAEASTTATATHATGKTPVKVHCDSLVIRNENGIEVDQSGLNITTAPDADLIINPALLTVVTQGAEKTYDGTALTAGGSCTGYVNGETATFKVTGSQTAVGTSSNTYSLTFDQTAAATDYTVNESLGTLTVNEYAGRITVTTTGGEYTYDGKSHGATVEVEGLPAAGGYRVAEATSAAKAKHVSDGPVTATCNTLVIENAAGEDVTSKLANQITYVDGSITIKPATLTVKTESASKAYDGDALTADGSISGFVASTAEDAEEGATETATFTVTGSQTSVGTSSNSYTIAWDGTAEKTDYKVSEDLGTLTVTQTTAQITVTTTGGTFTYDGTAHGATVEVTGLPKGYTAEASSDASATHVADGTVTASCTSLVIRNDKGEDVTSELEDNITYVSGSIEITPAALTVKTPDASKTYDGTALTAEGSIGGFVTGETASFATTGSQTEVGESENGYTLTFDKNAAESDYKVTASKGTLTVSESTAKITVTTTGGSFTYDGEAHGATVAVSTLPAGYTLEKASSSASATHVAEGPVTATCDTLVIKNAAGTDVTSKLNIEKIDGSITITKAPLTVTTETASKAYDGNALTAGGSCTGYVNGETATFSTTGTQTEVGSSNNTYSLTFDQTAAATDYTVNESLGTLTVSENTSQITVTTTGGEYTYDGTAHGATVTVTGLPTGFTATASSDDTATHVSEGTVTANCDHLTILNNKGIDVTSKLSKNIQYTDGSIKINPATLTVATPDASKTYDGDALTAAGSCTGFVNNETATFRTTGSQTAVGTSSNTYSLTFNGTAQAADYTVKQSLGTLTVTEYAGDITVVTTGGEYTYDGKSHGATVAVSKLPAGYTLEKASSSASATHVAEGTVTATCDTLVIKNAAGTDVTSRLNVKKTDGTIVINPATLTVTTPSKTKVYDGDALTAAGTAEGYVNGETATFSTTGTQTAVGSSDNTYTLVFNKTAKESDYTVESHVGVLTVTENADEITVTVSKDTYTYDGTAHGASKVTVSTLPAGYMLDKAESSARATHVSESTVEATCDTLVIKNAAGEDVTSKLNITKTAGSITITPAPITITTFSAERDYDGTALTAGGQIACSATEVTDLISPTGSQTEVGSSSNTYEVNWSAEGIIGFFKRLFGGSDVRSSDYSITEELGTLTVNESATEVEVTTTGGSFTYDGEAHGATVTVGTLPTGYTLVSKGCAATATHVADGLVTAACDNLVIKNASGKVVYDLANNVKLLNVKFTNGTIKIKPATLTVETGSATKVYDGKPLTADGSCTGYVNGEKASFTVTGSQTEVGSSNNTCSLTFDQTAAATDYTVNESLGTLTVNENADEITVTVTGGTFTYDGAEHGAKVTVSTLPQGYTLEKATSSARVQHVADGTEEAVCDDLVIKNAAGKVVYDLKGDVKKLTVNNESIANIKVTSAELRVVTQGAEKTYDGTALTAPGSIEGFVNNESAEFKVTGSRTNVGTSENTYEITWEGASAAESDYNVTADTGLLKVNAYAAAIVIKAKDASRTYNGEALTAGYELKSGSLVSGDELDVKTSGSITNAGSTANTIASCKVMRNGKDVTANYSGITTEAGTLTVNPATLTVKTESASKTYDGEALTADGSISGFVKEETATFAVTGTQTKVGDSDNTYTITWDGTASEDNYTVDASVGQLIVTELTDAIQVTVTGGTFTYDGEAHGATVTVSQLPKGYTLEAATSDASATNVADGTVTAKCDHLIIRNADGEDVTSKLNISETEGTIKITPKEVTVTAGSSSKVFGAAEPEFTASVTGTLGRDKIEYSVGRESGEAVGEYKVTADGQAVQGNYSVVYVPGKFEITEQSIVPEDPDYGEVVVNTPENVIYNGASQKWVPDVTDGETTLTEGTDYTVSYDTTDFVNVKTIKVTVKGIGNYKGTVERTYKILPKTVTITVDSKSKIYGADDPELTGTVAGVVDGDNLNVEYARAEADKDKENVGDDITLTASYDTENDNYSVTVRDGKLEITKSGANTVSATGATYTYDGKAHGIKSAEAAKTGSTILYKSGDGEWTETAPEFTAVKRNADGDVEAYTVSVKATNPNYNETAPVTVTVVINPATVKVTTYSNEKHYDGEALTAGGKVEGIVEGESVTFAATGTQTEVGNANNTYDLTWDNADESNYTLTEDIGTLVVLERSVDDEGFDVNDPTDVTYDGEEHKWVPTVQFKDNGLTEGADYTVSYDTTDFVNVKTIKVTVKGIGNFEGEITKTYNINPAEATVTADNAGKKFGTADPALTAKVSGIVKADEGKANLIVYKLARTAGEELGEYPITASGEKLQGNYNVEYVPAVFTIAKGSINPDDPEFSGYTAQNPDDTVYNGEEQKQPVVVKDPATGEELKEGKDYKVTYTDCTNTGTVTVTIEGIGDYEGQQTVTYRITPRHIVIKSVSDKKKYDGKPLTREKVEIGGSGLAASDQIVLKWEPGQTEVGSKKNRFKYVIIMKSVELLAYDSSLSAGVDMTYNYDVDVEFGTLKVTKADKPVPTPTPTPDNGGGNNAGGNIVRVTADGNGGYTLTTIADGQTPLANIFDDCCILHLLIMLLAWIVLMLYTKDMKDRQARIFELEEELSRRGIRYW